MFLTLLPSFYIYLVGKIEVTFFTSLNAILFVKELLGDNSLFLIQNGMSQIYLIFEADILLFRSE